MTHGKEKHDRSHRSYGIATSDTAALKEMMNKLEQYIQSKNLCLSSK
jgi:hypothetical protein